MMTSFIISCCLKVIGIITRHDLTHEKLHEIRHKKKQALDDSQFHMFDHSLRSVYKERFRSLNGDQTESDSDE